MEGLDSASTYNLALFKVRNSNGKQRFKGITEEKRISHGGEIFPLCIIIFRDCVKAAAVPFLMCVISSVKAKRKLDLEDPLYLPEFRTPKGKCSLAARIPSPKSEYSTTHEEPVSAGQ